MLPEDPPLALSSDKASLPVETLDSLVSADGRKEYDAHALLEAIVDAGSLEEYKQDYGKTIINGFARIAGIAVGVVANQRKAITSGRGEIEIGGVLYADSADKTARFILECNQMGIPIVFFQDVMGFMVGKVAEASGIIKSGAKLVNAISNSIVPKITCIVGNSFGAGHYALCGKAYDPRFIVAWPSARYAVMGAEQARSTLEAVKKKGKGGSEDLHDVQAIYEKQMDIRYAAARGWVDAIIPPHQTRDLLIQMLAWVKRAPLADASHFHTGVIQT
jgi:acetyl-CoA carboxylase carboxyltransferase component